MTLKEELEKLARLSKESSKEEVAEQIRRIGEEEGEVIYQIIIMLTKEKIERGYTKKYSLAELQKKMPWKKSRLIEKLQEAVIEKVLKHEKKKYLINKENELVKRIWNYYNEPNYKEKEKIEEIRNLIQRKKKLEKELEKEERMNGRKYREATKKEEKELRKVIKEELEEGLDPRDLIRKKTLEALGYKKQKEALNLK